MADRRLSDRDVERRLATLDEMLGQLEQIPGATAALALDAARALSEIYGEALARLMALVADVPPARDAAAADDLIGHLLGLHGIHPQPAARRVEHALDGVRPFLQSHGGDVRFDGITDGIARVRLTGACPSSASGLELAVRDAVLAVAPELHDVHLVRPAASPPLIPLSEVRRRPASPARRAAPSSGGAL